MDAGRIGVRVDLFGARGCAALLLGLVVAFLGLLAAPAPYAQADLGECDKTWLGGGGNWNSANWTGGTPPDSTTDVCIPTGSPSVFGTNSGAGTVTIDAGASLLDHERQRQQPRRAHRVVRRRERGNH